jgi:hypothetical protein
MVRFVLLLLLTTRVELQVDWSELSVHFYGPVDLAGDTLYKSELEVSLDSLLTDVPLYGELTLGDAVARSRDAENYFQTSISYPQVVSTRYSTAGKVQNEYVISLVGPFLEELIPRSTQPAYPREQEPDASMEYQEPSDLGSIPSTGFIIDARGTGFQPGIFPRLLDPDGNVILDAGNVDRNVLMERGYVRYAYTPRAALQTHELGLNPLRLVAERAVGRNRCDIVLSAADAERILGSPLNLRLLYECRVTIIIDRQ